MPCFAVAGTLQVTDMLIMDDAPFPTSDAPVTNMGQIVRIEINPDGSVGAASTYVSQQDVIDTVVVPTEGTPDTVRYADNDMALDEFGHLYFSESARDAIFVKRFCGDALQVLATELDIIAVTDELEAMPEYVTTAPERRLFFTDGVSDSLLEGFMTLDANGDILIVDDNDGLEDYQILRVDRLGGGVSVFLTDAQLVAADATGDDGAVDLDGGIHFDFDGNFYVAQEDGDTVLKFPLDPSGVAGVDVLGNAGAVLLNLDDILGETHDAEIESGFLIVGELNPDPLIPEPGTGALTLIGITLLAALARRRATVQSTRAHSQQSEPV